MSDRPDHDAKLLAETFHDDWTSGRAANFARAAAAHARRRRSIRRALAGASVSAFLVVAVVLALRPTPSVVASNPVKPSAPVAATRGYEIISDDELMTQLRDRPLLVVKRANGVREFVVLENE